jgi:glyoxylase-like metal-dependent hydrolase (beta-lactamase superfamily II)
MLDIIKLVLGPVATNTYLVGDQDTKQGVIIDPAWDGHLLAEKFHQLGWELLGVWLTHAHFDHYGGLADLLEYTEENVQDNFFVGLHPNDMNLWKMKGGAPLFGMNLKATPKPSHDFQDGELLNVGKYEFEVNHTPGHSSGHVIFYCQKEGVLFSGDLIFNQGIGRTDLPGGSFQELMDSIRRCVIPLPDETRIYSGHGPETTVGDEKRINPFILYENLE